MNKTYKYTIASGASKEVTFDVGVKRIAITNNDGVDGPTTVVMSEITKQHSGDLVSFIDGADAPFADFIVNIEAVQSGSGNPSPTNVRPISGWTGAIINVSGEDTSNPTTYNVNWQSTAGTVYGGTIDVKNGVLTVNRVMVDLGDFTWNKGSISGQFFCEYQFGAPVNPSSVLCSNFNRGNAYNPNEDNVISMRVGIYQRIWIYSTTYSSTSSTDFKTAMQGVKFVYPLATPVTYQLTPVEIRSLLGTNNVWADCGPVDVRYFVQSTQPMIDYIDEKTIVYFDAQENFSTYDISLVGATSTDVKNCLKTNKNANIVIRVKHYSTVELFYLHEYSPNYFADFASHAVIFDAEGTKSMRINYMRLDLTQETTDFTNDHIILPAT